MKLELFNKLQKKFENRRFEQHHLWTQRILYYGSFLGNILSIVLSFFFVNFLVGQTAVHFAGQGWILPLFIVLFLTIFEFAKRFTFATAITSFLTSKKINSGFLSGLVFSSLLVGLTFYLSLSGASYYANTSETIEVSTDSVISVKVDSINRYYVGENKKLEERVNYVYKAAESRKRKSLTEAEVKQVKDWETAIQSNKDQLEVKIKTIKEETKANEGKQKEKSNKNQLAFLIISGFIEVLILIGVGFRQFYDFVSFKEQKESLNRNQNYQKLIIYTDLMRVFYNNGKKGPGDSFPSFNQFKDLTYASGKKHSLKTLKEFLTLLNYLKVTQMSGKTRNVLVSYDQALETLQNYLTIENE